MNLIKIIFLLTLFSCRTLGNISLHNFHTPVMSPSYNQSELSPSKPYYPRVSTRQPYEVENCKNLGSKTTTSKSVEELQKEGDRIDAESVVFEESMESLTAQYYDCSEHFRTQSREWVERKSQSDFSFFAGRYIQRDGVLKKLGRMGPTLGVEYARFSEQHENHGFFLTWTFDHFWKTNGSLLKPEFSDQDYTNYMAGGGYAFRLPIGDRIQLHYRAGIAFNFIEIDSFRSNGDPDDGKYTDITLSTIQRLGFDILLKKRERRKLIPENQIRIGPTLFYYWAPDPIGKFKLTKEKKSDSPGGSLSLSLNFTFEFY